MTQKPETTTEQPITRSNYKAASVVGGDISISTTVSPPPIRTATTTINSGTITLRYAPREQPPLTGNTSS